MRTPVGTVPHIETEAELDAGDDDMAISDTVGGRGGRWVATGLAVRRLGRLYGFATEEG